MRKVTWKIVDAAGRTVATAESPVQAVAGGWLSMYSARLHSLPIRRCGRSTTPNLYSAIVTVEAGGKVRDAERVTFGVRTAVFDADKGFLLNGKPVKIQGTCNHQDHAGVGAAVPEPLQSFRLGVLREMGGNAVRTSHNMPTPEWVEACDRMGMMMMCETRQMSSSAEGMAQLEVMVKRYRNSPSIILWSIGNEECLLQDAMAEQGAEDRGHHGAPLPRTRSYARGFRRCERQTTRRASRWRLTSSGSTTTRNIPSVTTRIIPTRPSTARKHRAPSPRAACTRPTAAESGERLQRRGGLG